MWLLITSGWTNVSAIEPRAVRSGDQPPGMLDQISQDAKCLRRQANPLIISMIPVTPETLVDGVQPERRKLLHAERAVLCPSMLYPYNQVEAVVSHEKTPSGTMQFREMPLRMSGLHCSLTMRGTVAHPTLSATWDSANSSR